MATFIDAGDVSIFIDPAVSLAPRRFSLPPHELEWRRLREVAERIERRAGEADVVIITHYHYDHHDPGKYVSPEIYRGKVVIVKDPKNNINISQRIRSARFLKILKNYAKEILVAEGSNLRFGRTLVRISDPIPHGSTARLGYVVEVLVEGDDLKVLFTSDVEGPVLNEASEFIIRNRPDIVIVDGPPTYLTAVGRFEEGLIETAVSNLARIAALDPSPTLVVDHHLLRDLSYVNFYRLVIDRVFREYGLRPRILSAAGFMGAEPMLLEARRRELYGER